MDKQKARQCVMQMTSTREQNKANFRNFIEGFMGSGHLDPSIVFELAKPDRAREVGERHERGEVTFDEVLREIFIMEGAGHCLEIMNEQIIEHLDLK